ADRGEGALAAQEAEEHPGGGEGDDGGGEDGEDQGEGGGVEAAACEEVVDGGGGEVEQEDCGDEPLAAERAQELAGHDLARGERGCEQGLPCAAFALAADAGGGADGGGA